MSNDMNRRDLMKRAGALGLSAAALAKLGQVYAQDATPASPAASPVVDTSVSGELNIAMVANPQMVALQKLSGEFQKQYPNIKLNLLVLPENEIRDRIRTDVSTQATQFDVVTIGMF
ncbi:MAG: twin-arginine translocation signal domain-containing protein, partial [Thermomicrobiales bacterium]